MNSKVLFFAFLGDITSKLKVRFFALVVMSAICAVTDGLRILVAFLLLPFVGVPMEESGAGFLRRAYGLLESIGVPYSFGPVALFVVLVFSLQAALSIVTMWYEGTYTHYYALQWRQQLFRALSRARWRFFLDTSRGELLNAISQETARLATATARFLGFLSNLLVALAYIASAMFISLEATLVMALVGALVAVFNFSFVNRLMAHAKALVKGNSQMMAVTQEFLNNIKAIKAAPHGLALERMAASPLRAIFRAERVGYMIPNGSRVGAELFVMFALILAVAAVHRMENFDASSELLMVLALFMRAYGKITVTLTNAQQMFAQLPAFEHVTNIYQRAVAEEEPQWQTGEICDAAKLESGIKFQNVSVSHSKKAALENITVMLEPRSVVAVVGPSGAGKTTFVDTLLRLVDVDSGQISVSGNDIRNYNIQSWRACFGYVSQDFTLINGSFADNIRLFKPDASDDEVRRAAKLAHADEFIEELPSGYNSHLGEMGMKLSGGQRQRIAVARALMNDSPVLIFDEATSALDSESEQQVMRAVHEMRGKKLVILIAHRLSTVREADQILVLESGKLVEQGSWHALVDKGGVFSSLLKGQILHVGPEKN